MVPIGGTPFTLTTQRRSISKPPDLAAFAIGDESAVHPTLRDIQSRYGSTTDLKDAVNILDSRATGFKSHIDGLVTKYGESNVRDALFTFVNASVDTNEKLRTALSRIEPHLNKCHGDLVADLQHAFQSVVDIAVRERHDAHEAKAELQQQHRITALIIDQYKKAEERIHLPTIISNVQSVSSELGHAPGNHFVPQTQTELEIEVQELKRQLTIALQTVPGPSLSARSATGTNCRTANPMLTSVGPPIQGTTAALAADLSNQMDTTQLAGKMMPPG